MTTGARRSPSNQAGTQIRMPVASCTHEMTHGKLSSLSSRLFSTLKKPLKAYHASTATIVEAVEDISERERD